MNVREYLKSFNECFRFCLRQYLMEASGRYGPDRSMQ